MLRTANAVDWTFQNSPSRFFRLLILAVKLKLTVDPKIEDYLKQLDFYEDVYVFL